MMKFYKNLLLLAAIFTFSISNVMAQCEEGQTEIQLIMHTDGWGYENYWEVVNNGDICGEETIAWGGNDLDVGCDGTGNAEATGEDIYPDNTTIFVDPFCVNDGQLIDLHFIDSFGDGGLTIELLQNGILTNVYYGTDYGNVWTIDVGNFDVVDYNQPCQALEVEIDNGVYLLDNTGAFSGVNEVTPGGGSCAVSGVWCEGGVTNSVWASFIAPEGGALLISTCNEGTVPDTQLALYAGNDCMDMSSFSLVSANDDANGGCPDANGFSSRMYASCLVPGDQYFIQIDGYYGEAGEIYLSVSTEELTPSVSAAVNGIACPLGKGEQGTGSILPYVLGWGSNFTAEWTGPGEYESTDNFIYNLSAGEYMVTLTNACGDETLTETYTIVEPEYFSATYDVVDAECPLSGDGAISIDLTGGTGPYEFFWTGPDNFQIDTQNIENLDVGVYSLYVEDDNECVYEHDINLTVGEEFTFDLGGDITMCDDEDMVIYGPTGYLYTWQDGSENQFIEVDGPSLGEGSYSYILTAYNEEGCTHTDAIIVTIWNCSSVEEVDDQAPTLFPNPSNGAFTLDGMQAFSVGTLDVFDVAGKRIHSSQLTNELQGKAEFDMNFESGVYIVHVKLDDAMYSYSLVIE